MKRKREFSITSQRNDFEACQDPQKFSMIVLIVDVQCEC
jgi:hypothetical protein